MTEKNFKDFLALALENLNVKNKALSKKLIEDLNDPAWNISIEKRQIEWSDKVSSEIVLAYRCIPIGSYNRNKSTWLWSWANQSIPNNLELVKEISALAESFPDIPQFLSAKEFEESEDFAIGVTALLVELYDAVSFYKFADDNNKIDFYFYLKQLQDLEEDSIPGWLNKQAELSVVTGEQTLATSCLIDAIVNDVQTDHVDFMMAEDGTEIPSKPWKEEQKEALKRLQTKEGLTELLHRRVEQAEVYDELADDWLVGDDEDCKYSTKDEMVAAINFQYVLDISRLALDRIYCQ